MTEVPIRAAGRKNSQVAAEARSFLYDWLEDAGVADARDSVVLHHYCEGEFVAVRGEDPNSPEVFDAACEQLIDAHEEHRRTASRTIWVERDWIRSEIAKDD